MISIHANKKTLRFSAQAKNGSLQTREYSLENTGEAQTSLENIFNMAQKELQFEVSDDFRLLVDFPLCHSIAQMVPFPESQLSQVLENYLEEELAEDIEDYVFDFHTLAAKGTNSSILAFWIKRSVMEEWSDLANEYGLNSLDIQPAEMALVDLKSEVNTLQIQPDLNGSLRFSYLSNKDMLPHLCIGSLSTHDSPETIQQIFKMNITDISDLKRCILHPKIENKSVITDILSCDEKLEYDDSKYADLFEEYGLHENHKVLNYRKGEFAQKGIEEKIMIPVMLVFLALCASIFSLIYKNKKVEKSYERRVHLMQRQQQNIWKELIPDKKMPKSRIIPTLITAGGLKTEEDSSKSGDDTAYSALQDLGQLFLYIAEDDDVLITRAAINGKSISLKGTSIELPRVYKLGEGFKNQDKYNAPRIKGTESKKDDQKIYKFTFNTSRIEPEEK